MHDLAARLARGDEAAFAELYDGCADRLYRFALGRVDSPDAAADVVQAGFLRAVKSRRRFRRVENPISYLFQIVRNEAARANKARLQRKLTPTSVSLEAIAGSNGPAIDEADTVAAVLARLSDDDRELVELKVYGGLTFREIAELTSLPQGTVATRYRRALESLRGWLTSKLR